MEPWYQIYELLNGLGLTKVKVYNKFFIGNRFLAERTIGRAYMVQYVVCLSVRL